MDFDDGLEAASWREAMAFERRTVLKVLGGTLAATLIPQAPAFAADGELVLQNWGGTAAKAVMAAYAEATKQQTGLALTVDGSGSMAGKVKAMEDAKHVTVDIIDLDLGNTTQLGTLGLLDEIDYTIVDKAKVLPGLTTRWGIGNYLYSYIFAVNERRAKGKVPKTWADFWNVKDFPGKRGLPGGSQGVWEAALLADGVAPDKLYPIDIDRAIRKIKELKPDAIFWKTGAQSEDFLRQGEVMASLMWSNRAVVVRRQMAGITWGWDQAILAASGWSVPKDNPAGRKAASAVHRPRARPGRPGQGLRDRRHEPDQPGGLEADPSRGPALRRDRACRQAGHAERRLVRPACRRGRGPLRRGDLLLTPRSFLNLPTLPRSSGPCVASTRRAA